MADLSKLKTRRNSLGDPPPPEAASKNLLAPEIAPAPEVVVAVEQEPSGNAVVQLRPSSAPPPPAVEKVERKMPSKPAKKRVDGRSLRRTGRTLPFATRVSEAFDEKLRTIAERDGLSFAELLEKSLDAYEVTRKK